MYPADLKYTRDHEWVRVHGELADVGGTLALAIDDDGVHHVTFSLR